MFLVPSRRKSTSTTSELSPDSTLSSLSSPTTNYNRTHESKKNLIETKIYQNLTSNLPITDEDRSVEEESLDESKQLVLSRQNNFNSVNSTIEENEAGFIILIIKSSASIVARVLRETLSATRRWINASLRELVVSLGSLIRYFTSSVRFDRGIDVPPSKETLLTEQLAVCYSPSDYEEQCSDPISLPRNETFNNDDQFVHRAAGCSEIYKVEEEDLSVMDQYQRRRVAIESAKPQSTGGFWNWNYTPSASAFNKSAEQSQKLGHNSMSYPRPTSPPAIEFQGQRIAMPLSEQPRGAFNRATTTSTSAISPGISSAATRQHYDTLKPPPNYYLKCNSEASDQPSTARNPLEDHRGAEEGGIVADRISTHGRKQQQREQGHREQQHQQQMYSIAASTSLDDRRIEHAAYFGNLVEFEDDEGDDDEDKETLGESSSSRADEPYSLGSSYQDPSDFEEYCPFGDSLDRRTKDNMSQTTKLPNDLRFALIRLDDILKDKSSRTNNNNNIITSNPNRNNNASSVSLLESSSSSNSSSSSAGCIRIITEEWFAVTTRKDSQVARAKLYIEYFESFTKQLLNFVINLVDNAGNTAIHYAASHFNFDIIKLLLDTKVCDVNCKNKAGYTPIMLLALTEIDRPEDQDIARLLFSLGDVNIKARSSGQTALMLAASNGRPETCKLLLECGADPSLQDNDGSTALMCGSELGHEKVVRYLLASKLTDPTATDNDGLDALTIAMNNGHRHIGLILYAAKNVPKMNLRISPSEHRANQHLNNMSTDQLDSSYLSNLSPPKKSNSNTNSSGYLGASLRRTRPKVASNYVRGTDSLSKPRIARLAN